MDWKNIFSKHKIDRVLVPRLYEELTKLKSIKNLGGIVMLFYYNGLSGSDGKESTSNTGELSMIPG